MKWYGVLAIAYGAFLLGFFFAALLRAGKDSVIDYSAAYNPPPPESRRPEQPTQRPPAKQGGEG